LTLGALPKLTQLLEPAPSQRQFLWGALKFNAKKEKLHFCHLPTYKKEHRHIQGNKRMLPPNFPQIHPSNIPLSQNSEKLN
jgi:hypothetical protein